MKINYIVNIKFFYQAENADTALGIADNIAEYVETAKEYGQTFEFDGESPNEVDAKVGKPIIDKLAELDARKAE